MSSSRNLRVKNKKQKNVRGFLLAIKVGHKEDIYLASQKYEILELLPE
jgi:hypothetical protein